MTIGRLLPASLVLLLAATAASAGAPLKGVGVSPGNGATARTTSGQPHTHKRLTHTGKSPTVVNGARIKSHSNQTNN